MTAYSPSPAFAGASVPFITVDHVAATLRELGVEPVVANEAEGGSVSGRHLGYAFGVRLFEPSPAGDAGGFGAYKLEVAVEVEAGADLPALLQDLNAFNARVRYFKMTLRGPGDGAYCVLDADMRVGATPLSLFEDLHFFLISMSQMLFLVSSAQRSRRTTRAPEVVEASEPDEVAPTRH